MNRFAGRSTEDRTALIAAAVRAHRERASPYVTLEVDPASAPGSADGEDGPAPWVQYRDADGTINLDCTDEERESIGAALEGLGGVRITEQQTVEEGGTNLRIAVSGDDERVAHVIEQILREGFGLPADHRLWATEL
jgi:hypothetical protein